MTKLEQIADGQTDAVSSLLVAVVRRPRPTARVFRWCSGARTTEM
jgi:hypothetical protein